MPQYGPCRLSVEGCWCLRIVRIDPDDIPVSVFVSRSVDQTLPGYLSFACGSYWRTLHSLAISAAARKVIQVLYLIHFAKNCFCTCGDGSCPPTYYRYFLSVKYQTPDARQDKASRTM